MKLSIAIATGRTLVVATPNVRLDGRNYGCALGMADASYGREAWGANEIHKWLADQGIKLPCGCEWDGFYATYPSYSNAIAHLFNEHVFGAKDWTLDQLIDWIASVEPAEPAPAAEPVVAEAEAVRQ